MTDIEIDVKEDPIATTRRAFELAQQSDKPKREVDEAQLAHYRAIYDHGNLGPLDQKVYQQQIKRLSRDLGISEN